MPPPTDDRPRRSQWTLGRASLAVAMVAGNLTLWSIVTRSYGRFAAVVLVLTNAVLCLFAAPVVGFRLIPVLAIFTTAELTEAMLLQSANSPDNANRIAVVAVLGGAALVIMGVGISANRRRRRR